MRERGKPYCNNFGQDDVFIYVCWLKIQLSLDMLKKWNVQLLIKKTLETAHCIPISATGVDKFFQFVSTVATNVNGN